MEKKRKCSHFDKEIEDYCRKIKNNEKCDWCGLVDGDSLWHCIRCGMVGCGRYTKNKHAIKHYEKTEHSLLYSETQKIVWCYVCNISTLIPFEERVLCPISFNEEEGLVNLGNTCYMNAALQIFIHCSSFFESILIGKNTFFKQRQKNSYTLSLFFEKRKEIKGAISPRAILNNIRKIDSCFEGYQQQDSVDFIQKLLISLHEELKSDQKKNPLFEGKSIVSDLFGGLLKSSIRCSNCKNNSEKIEPIYDMSIEITNNNKSDFLSKASEMFYEKETSLRESLDSFFSIEKLNKDNKYHCDNCKEMVEITKKLSLLRPTPNVLIIQLKRFKTGQSMFSKIKKHVKFSEFLDIEKYCEGEDGTTIYELSSVIVHHGSFGGGHYVSYCKKNNDWFLCNDTSIYKVTLETVLNTQAYVLVYQKKQLLMSIKKKLLISLEDKKEETYAVTERLLQKLFCSEFDSIYNNDLFCEHGMLIDDGNNCVSYPTKEFYYKHFIGKKTDPKGFCSICSET